jgi:hypothetical protein
MTSLPLVRATRLICSSSSGEGAAGVGQPARFGHPMGRTGASIDEPVGDGPVEQGAGGGDDMFADVAAVSAVAA